VGGHGPEWLANLWTAAESALRDEITSASAQIDERLRRDPLGSSESRTSGRRILFQLPLAVILREITVSVLRVWLIRSRTQP
jgi:hypothetical protein